jgi:hypothetical protein
MHEIPKEQILNELASVFAIRHYDEPRSAFWRRHGMGVPPFVVSAMVNNASLLHLPSQRP